MRPAQEIQVRSKRRFDWFSIDNEIIDEYGPRIGHHGIAVYAALCRFANDKTQQSTVGITKLAQKLRMGRAKLLSTLEALKQEGLVEIEAGDRAHCSVYTLLEVKQGGSNENQGGSNENQVGGSDENCIKTRENKTNNKTVVGGNVTYLDPVTSQCLQLLKKAKGFPRDDATNAERLSECREEFPQVDPVEVVRDYVANVKEVPIKRGDNPRLKLRNFFKSAHKRSQTEHPKSSRPTYEYLPELN